MTYSSLGGTPGLTTPLLPASAGPGGQTNADSSRDHSNYGDLARNIFYIFDIKQKAATLRISLHDFQHIWPRTAGEAVFRTRSLSLCLRFVSYRWDSRGLQKRAATPEQGASRIPAELTSANAESAAAQLNSNLSIQKTSHQTEDNNSLRL